jgi:hypothetical protein
LFFFGLGGIAEILVIVISPATSIASIALYSKLKTKTTESKIGMTLSVIYLLISLLAIVATIVFIAP